LLALAVGLEEELVVVEPFELFFEPHPAARAVRAITATT
jgi:hypothetical protein